MNNIKLILKKDSYYPQNLLKLKIAPEFLFAIGNTNLLDSFCIGIVGARACQEESIILTRELVKKLISQNITIVSGMANGIDSIAHETCIEESGKTIAIIGSGFNTAKRCKIFSKILNNDGLILTEYFPDIPAMPYNFPRRNQILATICKGVVAVETHLSSGTMITAQEALNNKVPLFTFPGGVFNKSYLGNNLLLTQGAICINSYEDLKQQLKNIYPNFTFKEESIKKSIKLIPEKYKSIYSVLDKIPKSIELIAHNLNLPLKEIQSKLTLMEMEDLVIKFSNSQWALK